ncbi:MAG: response regulator [Dehalococcoidia bacterium]
MLRVQGHIKHRVLALDDQQELLRLLERLLIRAGYEAIVTTDPAQVAPLAKAMTPAIILLDIHLPGTTGFEVFKGVREVCGAPVIFLTSDDRAATKAHAVQVGADLLTKPVNPSELFTLMKAALSTA